MFSVRVLFIHHKNDEVTKSNYQSFCTHGNKVSALRDSDANGLDESIPVAISGLPIPRSDRYWSSDTIAMNYVLTNEVTESHVLLCEWDVHCEANLEQLLKPYENNDVTAAELLTIEKDGWWQHFKTIDAEMPLLGLLPGTMLLFKVSALRKIAAYCCDYWDTVAKTNNEARLGTVAKHLGLVTGRYSPAIRRNIKWHDTKFIGEGLVYHPWKQISMVIQKCDFQENIYCHCGGGMGDHVAILSKILYEEQDNASSYIYFDDADDKRQKRLSTLLTIFDTHKKLKFVDPSFHAEIERKFLGYSQDHQFPYYQAKDIWKYREDMEYDICYQFETAKESVWYNPCKVMSEELQTSILKWWNDSGYKVKKLGLPNDLENDIATIRNSKIFVGICSGMSTIVHAIGTPIFLKEYDRNIKKHLDWHYIDFFHANQVFAGFNDTDELKRRIETYTLLKHYQKNNWKRSNIFRTGWSDRIPYYATNTI